MHLDVELALRQPHQSLEPQPERRQGVPGATDGAGAGEAMLKVVGHPGQRVLVLALVQLRERSQDAGTDYSVVQGGLRAVVVRQGAKRPTPSVAQQARHRAQPRLHHVERALRA